MIPRNRFTESATLFLFLILCIWPANIVKSQVHEKNLNISPESISAWQKSGEGTFEVKKNEASSDLRGRAPEFKLYWNSEDGNSPGTLISPEFTITEKVQYFDIAGNLGNTADGAIGSFLLRLKSAKDNEILREITVNGYSFASSEHWITPELLGKKVYLEIYAPVLTGFLGSKDIWMALENYRQEAGNYEGEMEKSSLYGIEIDQGAHINYCRSIPFLVTRPGTAGNTSRITEKNTERIPVNASAETIYLLGIINHGWENGVAHWSEHPETVVKRDDQLYIGKQTGSLFIEYEDGNRDSIPLIIGSTMWFSNHWAHGASHDVSVPSREPFDSRPELMSVFRKTLKVKEDSYPGSFASDHKRFYLAVKPAEKKITSISIRDDEETRGKPLLSAITIKSAKQKGLYSFHKAEVLVEDLEPSLDLKDPPDYHKDAATLARILYTCDSDMPVNPDPVKFPETLDATQIRFTGGSEAAWLNNIWAANLAQIHEKFDVETGYFRETGEDCPWYGGYSGIGTWCHQGIYPAAYSRTSDHFVTLALRHINNPRRETSFVDFCDEWLYFYRTNHDPEKGPPNENMKIDQYPEDAPPHWSMELSRPPTAGGLLNINEIYGDEEMDGHAATIVGRWYAWKLQGGNSGEWLNEKRDNIYNKSRWESTRDATEFICWLMDYTGRDLVYSEGEFTGWGGIVNNYCLVPKNMSEETDPEIIRQNYANANMYEPYPNYACMTALECAAEMADAAGETEYAGKWRSYAETIRNAMVRQLIAGSRNFLTWRISPYSILTTFQDRLVQAFFSLYKSGIDTKKWDQEMLALTRNTFHEHMKQPYGYSPVLAMGYGQGWLTHSALILDEMDHAGKLLVNMAKYSYDKNMDYVDAERNIDWRRWAWIIPEGVNILPDGSWHRINDLSNGANQGPAMHAIEACAGVDDSHPEKTLLMPRIPEPLTGIEVKNHLVMIQDGKNLVKNAIDYNFIKNESFEMWAEMNIPDLAVRLGPWENEAEAEKAMRAAQEQGFESRIEACGTYMEGEAWWIWVENLRNMKELKVKLN